MRTIEMWAGRTAVTSVEVPPETFRYRSDCILTSRQLLGLFGHFQKHGRVTRWRENLDSFFSIATLELFFAYFESTIKTIDGPLGPGRQLPTQCNKLSHFHLEAKTNLKNLKNSTPLKFYVKIIETKKACASARN